jgi:hypothetical protein
VAELFAESSAGDDDCEDADTQTDFHGCPPKTVLAIQLPRVALPGPALELDRSILLKHLVSPARHADNNRMRDRSEREAHRENPAMVVLVGLGYGDLHTTAMLRWSRSASGKLPSTSPGVRKTSFFPSSVPPDQNVEFCSSTGQILPLIL